jgi:hypothetical protein
MIITLERLAEQDDIRATRQHARRERTKRRKNK